MRRALPALLFLATACSTTAPEPAERSSTTVERDTPAASISLEDLLKRTQAASGLNFTYAEDVAKVLRATPAASTDANAIPPAELEPLLRRRLDAAGLELVPIGPEHLRVLQVRRKAS